MERIEFNEENEFHMRARKTGYYEQPKMVRYLVDKGIVKNEKQAHYLLLGVSVFLLAIVFVMIYSRFNTEVRVYDQSGNEYTIEEQLRAIKSGAKTFDDFR